MPQTSQGTATMPKARAPAAIANSRPRSDFGCAIACTRLRMPIAGNDNLSAAAAAAGRREE